MPEKKSGVGSPLMLAEVETMGRRWRLQSDETPREPSQIIMLGPTGEVKVIRP